MKFKYYCPFFIIILTVELSMDYFCNNSVKIISSICTDLSYEIIIILTFCFLVN